MSIYPCRSCIIYVCCSAICPKIESKNRAAVQESLDKNICPDCGFEIIEVTEFLAPLGNMTSKICDNCHHAFSLMLSTYLKRYYVNRNL